MKTSMKEVVATTSAVATWSNPISIFPISRRLMLYLLYILPRCFVNVETSGFWSDFVEVTASKGGLELNTSLRYLRIECRQRDSREYAWSLRSKHLMYNEQNIFLRGDNSSYLRASTKRSFSLRGPWAPNSALLVSNAIICRSQSNMLLGSVT